MNTQLISIPEDVAHALLKKNVPVTVQYFIDASAMRESKARVKAPVKAKAPVDYTNVPDKLRKYRRSAPQGGRVLRTPLSANLKKLEGMTCRRPALKNTLVQLFTEHPVVPRDVVTQYLIQHSEVTHAGNVSAYINSWLDIKVLIKK